MEYRWCIGCHTLIDARLVFCTEQCSNAYYADPAREPTEAEKRLSGAILARLAFVQWVRGQRRLTMFDEEVVNRDVVARY